MTNHRRALCLLLLPFLTLSLLGPGCKSTGSKVSPRAWSLKITKATPATIEVDVIGVAPLEKPAWQAYSVDKYFSANDPRRTPLKLGRDRVTSMLQSSEPWIIDRKADQELWTGWLDRGATEVLLLARLPGKFEAGPADPRRLFVPLDKSTWDAKDRTIEIEIQDTLIRVMTRQKR